MRKIYCSIILLLVAFTIAKATPSISGFSVYDHYLQNGKIKVYPKGPITEFYANISATRAFMGNQYEQVEMEVVFYITTRDNIRHDLKTIIIKSSDFNDFYLANFLDGPNANPLAKNDVKIAIPTNINDGTIRLKYRYKDLNGVWEPNSSNFHYIELNNYSYQTILITPVTQSWGEMPMGMRAFAAQYGPFPSVVYTAIYPNDNSPALTVGQSIHSPNNVFRLTLQQDGNLVLYKKIDSTSEIPIWWSNTHNSSTKPNSLFFQTDGHLVLYSGLNLHSVAIWASRRYNPGPIGVPLFGTVPNTAFYALQDDGNFVFYWTFTENQQRFKYVIANSGTQNGGRLSPHIGTLEI